MGDVVRVLACGVETRRDLRSVADRPVARLVASRMTEDRVDWHLWNWARYHRRSRVRPQGYPNASTGIDNYSSGMDFDAECEGIDKRCAVATDAVIDDLPKIERMAVYAMHLEGPWVGGCGDQGLALYYRAAIPMIGRGLDKRGIV